jgi:hypothetical protein
MAVLIIIFYGRDQDNVLNHSKVGEIFIDFLEGDILGHAVDVKLVIIVVSLDVCKRFSYFDFFERFDDLAYMRSWVPCAAEILSIALYLSYLLVS